MKQVDLIPGTYKFLYHSEEVKYRRNLKKHFDKMKELGWDNPDAIVYNINNQGFRSDFDYNQTDECNVYLGCSHTLGDSMPHDSIWPTLVNNKLNDYKLYNLGVSGASSVTCYRIFNNLINKIKVKRVFMLSPATNRKEMYYHDRWQTFKLTDNPFSANAETLNTIFSYELAELEKRMAIDAIQHLCFKKNVPFFEIDAEARRIQDNSARDLHHFGKNTHQMLADMFLRMI